MKFYAIFTHQVDMSCVSLFLLVAVLSTANVLEANCPNNTFLSQYIEKLENATETVITDIQGIVLTSEGNTTNGTASGPPNSTTLYNALTTSRNITASTEGLRNFTKTLEVITDSYFKSCYGPVEEKPKIEDSPAILQEFLFLLENRTEIVKIRELFGRLSCLQNFTKASSDLPLMRRKKRQSMMPANLFACAQASTLAELYDCLDANDQFECIFNLNDPQNCGNSGQLSVKSKKHCLAFSIDTTGSMADELNSVRQVVLNFIQSEENEITLCYVMVPFNDFGYPAYPNLGSK